MLRLKGKVAFITGVVLIYTLNLQNLDCSKLNIIPNLVQYVFFK